MSLHIENQLPFQNHDQGVKPQLKTWRQVTIFKSRSRCQTPFRNLWHTPKPQIRTWEDMNVLCSFKIKIESKNSENRIIKDYWLYQNQDQDPKPQQGTSSTIQCPKFLLQGHRCSFHLQNLDNRIIKDQWPYPSQDRDPKPKSGTSDSSLAKNQDLKDMIFLAPSNSR